MVKVQSTETLLMAPTLMTFLMAQANVEPTFSCINTLTILKPSYYSSYLWITQKKTYKLILGYRQCTYNVTLRRVRVTTTAMESKKY
jgi:hypothetical protein